MNCFIFLVVSSFLHGKMDQGRDLVNIHGLIRLFYKDVSILLEKKEGTEQNDGIANRRKFEKITLI